MTFQLCHAQQKVKESMPAKENNKLIIYQLLPRLFGNTNTRNKVYGSIEENGVGKFNDITNKALLQLKDMGFTHMYYTGVIEHASMTDYSQYGIKVDDPDVVKGRAGSPYAIKDYYDVDPDLAVDVKNRMNEFEALIKRTHENGLKVIIDFVPNHVARTYASDSHPTGVRDFGQDDDKTQAFSAKNDFYYLPGQPFVVPPGYNPGGDGFSSTLKDGKFDEVPAKVTGNNAFTATPGINDWFETIKLNYGVDYLNGHKTHFDPVPPLWNKMYDILDFWTNKGVDAFRCDMVEYVPFEFWGWVITKLKAKHPNLLFIGEAYNTGEYHNYINIGKFDYLYDKVGLYDAIRRLVTNQPNATTWDINSVWNNDTRGIDEHMLRFMENHDEQRIASRAFAGDAYYGVPGMLVTATLATGPVMVYAGQEVGEPASGAEGFGGDDGRSSIFDYWGVPELQKWVNNGQFDGGQLSQSQRQLHTFYHRLLNTVKSNEALSNGKFYELMLANEHQPGFNNRIYMYLRYTDNQRVLVICNFNRHEQNMHVVFPPDLLRQLKLGGKIDFTDLINGNKFSTVDVTSGVDIYLSPTSGYLLNF
ncbi:MAG: alpha-amylase family glycosyl hydrolase [Mucilaginibacter sp.]